MVKISTNLGFWGNLLFQKDDIRFNYDLGGGAMMDLGRELQMLTNNSFRP